MAIIGIYLGKSARNGSQNQAEILSILRDAGYNIDLKQGTDPDFYFQIDSDGVQTVLMTINNNFGNAKYAARVISSP